MAEGVPDYGPILKSLTTTGDTSPKSSLAVDRFPTLVWSRFLLPEILADTERLAGLFHESERGAMSQITVAPCSPFSVTRRLMEESGADALRFALIHGAAPGLDQRFGPQRLDFGFVRFESADTGLLDSLSATVSLNRQGDGRRQTVRQTCRLAARSLL